MKYREKIEQLEKFCLNTIIDEMDDDKEDGRLKSAIMEKIVLDKLSTYANEINISFKLGPSRGWYDFQFAGLYFNLKITEGNTADNAFQKIGVIYSITGKIPNNGKQTDKKTKNIII